MKQLFLLSCLLLALACNNAVPAGKAPENDTAAGTAQAKDSIPVADTSTLNGAWVLQPQLSSDTAAGRMPRIQFDVNAGRFTGNTGCNSMSGSFVKKADSLVFDQRIITTRIACTGYNEKAFLDNLLRVNHYEIANGVLLLKENETVLFRWVRKTTPPVNKA